MNLLATNNESVTNITNDANVRFVTFVGDSFISNQEKQK